MTSHDNSYKLLFSHARMVEDLLRGFVHEAWIEELDFGTLEKVSGSYITDDLRDREDDIIWRVRWGKNWLYVYLLIEFQSRADPHMAVRIMTYLGLLYQELIRQKKLTESSKLPPVLPVVLYNGNARWLEATDIADLVEVVPGGLEKYLPRLRYLLLDEGAIDESPQLSLRNLAAALFRLEKSREPEGMREVVSALVEWLKASEQTGLRRAFTVWIKSPTTGTRARRRDTRSSGFTGGKDNAGRKSNRMDRAVETAGSSGRPSAGSSPRRNTDAEAFADPPFWHLARVGAISFRTGKTGST